MSWVATGVSVGSALFGSHKAKKAAKQEAAGIQRAIDVQSGTYDTSKNYLTPRLEQERSAMGRVNSLLGLGGEAPDYSLFRNTPGYQFQLDQGQQSIERSAAARGGLFSGNTGVALQQHGQGLADMTYRNYLTDVMGLANQGADTNLANLTSNYGANVGNLLTKQGGARASGTVDSANALIGGANSLLDIYGKRKGWGSAGGGG